MPASTMPSYNILTAEEFTTMCNNFTHSIGPDGRVHCPKETPLNRARGKKITYMHGYLYCNSIMYDEIKNIIDFEEQTNAHITQHPKSRMRFKTKNEISASQLSLIIESL